MVFVIQLSSLNNWVIIMTYLQNANQAKLDISPSELGLEKNAMKNVANEIETLLFKNIILNSPHECSICSTKMKDYDFTKCTINGFVETLFKKMKIENIHFFTVFNEKDGKSEKFDLKHDICNENNTCIYLKINDTILKSIYSSIRNCFAHGNILFDGSYYYLFSFSENDHGQNNQKITFYLKIKNLRYLSRYYELLKPHFI